MREVTPGMLFHDRREAGRELARGLLEHRDEEALADPLVLALPRGGVPVGDEVARALGAPLDIIVARKIGAPFNPEVGVGALAGEGPPLYDERALAMLDLTADRLSPEVARERAEMHRREQLYRGARPAPDVKGRTVVVVDDGLATGVTARAALRAVRAMEPGRLVLAVPVGSPDAAEALAAEADTVVCPHRPQPFHAVGQWYQEFDQVGDDEVVAILRSHGGG